MNSLKALLPTPCTPTAVRLQGTRQGGKARNRLEGRVLLLWLQRGVTTQLTTLSTRLHSRVGAVRVQVWRVDLRLAWRLGIHGEKPPTHPHRAKPRPSCSGAIAHQGPLARTAFSSATAYVFTLSQTKVNGVCEHLGAGTRDTGFWWGCASAEVQRPPLALRH